MCVWVFAFSFMRCPKNGNWIHASIQFLFVVLLMEGGAGVVQTVRIAHSHHVLRFIIFHSLYDCLACTHTSMLSTIFAFAFIHMSIPFWNLFSLYYQCIYCVYFLLLFISYFMYTIHNTWFHLNNFLANCDEVIPIATGPPCTSYEREDKTLIEWSNHLSETLRNKWYFIHLYSNFSIIITVPFLCLSMSLYVANLCDYSMYSFVSPVPFGVTCASVSIHIFYCVIIPFYQNRNERVPKMTQRKSNKKNRKK